MAKYFDKNKFLHHKFAEDIRKHYHVIKIDEVLHVYKRNNCYLDDKVEIEKIIVQLIPQLNMKQRAEVLSHIRITAEERTRNKDYVTVLNGLYNIETQKLIPHSSKIITTNMNPFKVNMNVYSKVMDEALDSWCNNDKELRLLLEEMIGYCFLPDNRFHKSFILYGDGRNGKSTFLKVLQALIGIKNYFSASLQDLEDKYMVAQLYNKQVNFGDDIPNTSVKDTSFFKKITTGDMLTGRHVYEKPFHFEPYCKLIFASNHMVKFNDQSNGLYRRICFIPFDNIFSKETEEYEVLFEKKLTSEGALSYLFKVAMEGLDRLIKNKGFTEPEVVKQLELKFLRFNHHSAVEFTEDNDIIGKTVENTYSVYSNWCLLTGKKVESKNSFGKMLSKMGITSEIRKISGKSVRVYVKN